MDSEWDEAKRRANILKHGLDFVAAVKVFDGWFIEPWTRDASMASDAIGLSESWTAR